MTFIHSFNFSLHYYVDDTRRNINHTSVGSVHASINITIQQLNEFTNYILKYLLLGSIVI